ncbi:Ger(x)C family spore germination C-terminal domain-containing protein, partial [Geobacillus sp. MR]|uniref:Ger(x)C family spore germination C-terminal domain-containing protein n=1 Tax=Geobacillus sp. MR TaxID=2508875 RepID=UPI00273982C3
RECGMLVHREHLLGLFVSLLTFYRKGALFSIPFGFYWIINTPAFEQQIRSQTEALLRRFQEKQIDPIGFGDLAASRYRQFRHRDFYKHYSQLPIRITADVTIRDTGIIE